MANSYDNDEKLYKILKRLIHDLRSPLDGLKMWLYDTSSRLPPDEKESLEVIAKRIEDSINRTSLEADNKEAAITLLNVNFLIKDILLQKKVEYMEHDIKIIYNKPDNYHDININGVKDDFSRMLSNLINNAVEACSDKYGIIRIELQKSNSITTLTINDNGCGIPGEVLQMLRDGKTITHGKTSGHGIGMQQIREAITKCNGTLDIKSILGNGSTFAIMFETK